MELHSPGIKPTPPAMAAESLPLNHQQSPPYLKRTGQVDPRPGTTGTGPLRPSQEENHGNLTAASCLVAQSCPTLCDPMDCSPPDSTVHGILEARILEWVAISCSRGSSDPGTEPRSPALAGGFFTTMPPGKPTAAPSPSSSLWGPHPDLPWVSYGRSSQGTNSQKLRSCLSW